MQRRTFLRLAATAPLVSSLATRAFSANAPAAMAGKLLVRGDLSPVNLEMPLAGFKDYITPNDLFYVRSHFAAPTINRATWSLSVDQHVGKALKLSYDDLKRLPSKTVTATLECSGNGRSFLEPKKKGVQWEVGAVGNARWTGVPVADVLRRAEIKAGAVDVVFVGADRGKKDDEELQFLRSVPLAKAHRPGCNPGVRNEWAAVNGQSRFSAASHRAGVVWSRLGQVVGTNHRQRQAIPNVLAIGRLQHLGQKNGRSPHAAHYSAASQIRDRQPGGRSDTGREHESNHQRRRLERRDRRHEGRSQHRRRSHLESGRPHRSPSERRLAALAVLLENAGQTGASQALVPSDRCRRKSATNRSRRRPPKLSYQSPGTGRRRDSLTGLAAKGIASGGRRLDAARSITASVRPDQSTPQTINSPQTVIAPPAIRTARGSSQRPKAKPARIPPTCKMAVANRNPIA